jgi:hypothetical protein
MAETALERQLTTTITKSQMKPKIASLPAGGVLSTKASRVEALPAA